MAAFRLRGRRRARDAKRSSGVAMVVEGRPNRVKDRSCHWLAVENQGMFASIQIGAACLIQYPSRAHECLVFEPPHKQSLAVMPAKLVIMNGTARGEFAMQRHPPGACSAQVRTTVSYTISDDGLIWPGDPAHEQTVVLNYSIQVR
jgi:hypothetical protein